jgi:hypothetical protein
VNGGEKCTRIQSISFIYPFNSIQVLLIVIHISDHNDANDNVKNKSKEVERKRTIKPVAVADLTEPHLISFAFYYACQTTC